MNPTILDQIVRQQEEITRLTKQRDELVAALHWIALQPASGAIQCKALEALAAVKEKT